ncbi:MAG: hypothetical protein QOJ94_3041 [Sphingomonadales bacterium]|jgi:hypothetical protein|nr:hypothetical protein [Sphingomonadales bacterium]
MSLHVVDYRGVAADLSALTGDIVVIIAPNFEERSTAMPKRLIRDFKKANIQRSRVRWFVLTIQGSHSPEILDAVKAIYTRKVIGRLVDAGYPLERVHHQVVAYPMASEKFTSLLARSFRLLDGPLNLIIDFSALPRNLLSTLLTQVASSGPPAAALPNVRTAWLVYANAKLYPDGSGPEFVGNIIGNFTGIPLRELLEHKTHADIVLLAGGSGHDAFEVLDIVRSTKLGNQIRLHVVNYISDTNLHESHRKLRHHYGLLAEAQRLGADIRYIFSVRHALEFMRQTARRCASVRNSGFSTLFAVAPFGPKPFAVAAHFVRQEYLGMLTDREYLEADVLNSSGTQYLSLYSMGVGPPLAFRLDRPAWEITSGERE